VIYLVLRKELLLSLGNKVFWSLLCLSNQKDCCHFLKELHPEVQMVLLPMHNLSSLNKIPEMQKFKWVREIFLR